MLGTSPYAACLAFLDSAAASTAQSGARGGARRAALQGPHLREPRELRARGSLMAAWRSRTSRLTRGLLLNTRGRI